MRTIAVIARKGGSGKTTVAVHLAIAAHLRGLHVLLADADNQRSASTVLSAREPSGPDLVQTTGPKLFALQVASVRSGVDVMFIDTPAALDDELAYSIVASDLALMVLRPTFLDIAAAVQTADIIRRLGKPGLIVLNQASIAQGGRESADVRRALEAIALLDLPVAPVVLRSRRGYQSALASGSSVEEIPGSPAAAAEIANLWAFIQARLEGAPEAE